MEDRFLKFHLQKKKLEIFSKCSNYLQAGNKERWSCPLICQLHYFWLLTVRSSKVTNGSQGGNAGDGTSLSCPALVMVQVDPCYKSVLMASSLRKHRSLQCLAVWQRAVHRTWEVGLSSCHLDPGTEFWRSGLAEHLTSSHSFPYYLLTDLFCCC